MPAPPMPTKWSLRPTSCRSVIAATVACDPVRIGSRIAVAVFLALAVAAPANAVAPAPVQQAPPQLQGPSPPQDGLTYTAKAGQWDGPPGMTISRQWLRCNSGGSACQGIAGATGTSYTLSAADVGARIRVRETARCAITSSVCQPADSDSSPTGVVLPDPNNEAAPQISGLAQVGQVLSASVGFWRSPAPLSFAYQWIRCDGAGTNCANLPGATAADYRIQPGELGANLRVVVTARNSRPRSGSAASAQTPAVVAAPAPAPVRRKKGAGRRLRLLSPFPRIVIAGLVSNRGVQLTEFTVRGPRGTLVRITCKGRGCPFRSKRLVARRSRVRVRSLERDWRAGPVLEVTVTRRGFIGKLSRFRFRSGNVPRRQDLCLKPGAKRPSRCPRA